MMGWTTAALGLYAGMVILVVTTPVGVSGAVFLLSVQLSVLAVPSPAVTPTNLLFNVVAGPAELLRYRRGGALASPLIRRLVAGTARCCHRRRDPRVRRPRPPRRPSDRRDATAAPGVWLILPTVPRHRSDGHQSQRVPTAVSPKICCQVEDAGDRGTSATVKPRLRRDPHDQRGLIDTHGRTAVDLRVSLTDKCNLRCTYCMPAEGLDWLVGPDLLTDAEIVRLIGIGVTRLGIREVAFHRRRAADPACSAGTSRICAPRCAAGVPTARSPTGGGRGGGETARPRDQRSELSATGASDVGDRRLNTLGPDRRDAAGCPMAKGTIPGRLLYRDHGSTVR
jgi:hypothetical protein